MNRTVIKNLLALALFICGLGMASQAAALGFADALGSYIPAEPASPADEVTFINTLIAQSLNSSNTINLGNPQDPYTFDRTGNTCGGGACPTAVEAGNQEGGITGSVDVTGFTYLLGKYSQTGFVWFVGDLTGIQTIPTNCENGKEGCGGLSHSRLYNPGTTTVPEPGTLLLVGTGLLAVGLWRRTR